MKLATLALTASMFGGLATAPQPQAPQTPSPGRETRELTDVFPADVKVDPKVDVFALTADGQRTYFSNSAGEIWLFDHTRKTRDRVIAGPVWDLNVSAAGNALAYTKGGEHRGDAFVWVLTLNPATGLAAGAERQLSTRQGDAPSISPDGKIVAFARDDASGVGQSLVAVPIGGGAERVVAQALPSSVANIRWTPDGKTLYFGVNPPVACVPEWSCLPLNQDLRQPPGSLRKVAVAGGAVTTIATARGFTPGLSPDGTTLMFLENATTRRWIIANADGTQRDTLTLPSTDAPVGWLKGSTLILASSGALRRLRTMSLADGQSKIAIDGADALAELSWSPDSKLATTIARSNAKQELRILNADGSLQRSVTLPESFVTGAVWSPDQRRIAYTAYGDSPPARITVLDLTTGRTQPIYDVNNDAGVAIRWLPDARRLLITETYIRQTTPNRRVVFNAVDLDGKTTLLKEFPLIAPPGGGIAIDETTALVMQDAQTGFRIVRLDGDTSARELPFRGTDASPVSVSADGQWVTRRRAATASENGATAVLEIARIDGSGRRTIPLSFNPVGGSPRFLSGSDAFVVTEARRQDGGDSGVYLVPSGSQTPRKLFSYAAQYGPVDLGVSPDGRSLLYLVSESVPPSLRSMDLSSPRVR